MRPYRRNPQRRDDRTRRRDDQKRKERRLAYGIYGLVAAVAVCVVGAMIVFRPADVNPLTGCPRENTAPEAHTIILVDETDRLPRGELEFVSDLIATEYRWLPMAGRLTVRTIVADPSEAADILSICRIAHESASGGMIDNERDIAARFQAIAGVQIDALIETLTTAPEQDASPILESMADTLDRTDFGSNVGQRRLVVVSDFAQHSELYSMYGGGDRAREELPEEVMEEVRGDMSGVDVRLQYVRRRQLSRLQGREHRDLWRSIVEDQEPRSVAIGHDLLIGEPTDAQTWTYEPPE